MEDTSRGFSSGLLTGYLIGSSTTASDPITFECIRPRWFRKYFFYSNPNDLDNVYAIVTHWVVKHDNLVKQSIIDSGMHLYSGNPTNDSCGWLENRNYDWDYDYVLVKGNASLVLDKVALKATSQSAGIEWALIFIWAWLPIGLALLYGILECLWKCANGKAQEHPKTPEYLDGPYARV